MKAGMMPKTWLGKISLVLAAANIILTSISLVLLARGDLGTAAVPVNTWIGAVSGLLSIAALAVGVIAIIRSRERSKILYLFLVLILLVFLLGELMYPH